MAYDITQTKLVEGTDGGDEFVVSDVSFLLTSAEITYFL